MIGRQIGIAHPGHRLGGTAAVGASHTGTSDYREQRDCENFQHSYLFFRSMNPQSFKMETNIEGAICA